MYMNMKSEYLKSHGVKLLFLIVILTAFFLRVYKIDQIPPSLTWDEVSVGYNAWTIANYGQDEWGETFPLAFKSFEEYKLPVHIYMTAISVKLFGLNEIVTRAPSAIFGTLNIVLIFFLAKKILKSSLAGLFASFSLAVSPYAIHFSRFNHEANFTLFFFILGLLLFLIGLEKEKLLTVGFLSFGVSLISYNAAKVIVPGLILLLCLFFIKKLIKNKYFYIGAVIFSLFLGLILINPGLSGKSRAEQTGGFSLLDQDVLVQRYLSYFTTDYLFFKGDKNPRLGVQVTGQFYLVESLFLILGIMMLINKLKIGFFLLVWALIGPIPGVLFGGEDEIPHAARAIFVLGSWQMISAAGLLGLLNTIDKFKLKVSTWIKYTITLVVIILMAIQFKSWFINYMNEFNKYAVDYQYGMKEIVQYISDNDKYSKIYMTEVRSQPYIFFLYYLKTPLSNFLDSVQYNDQQNRSANLVSSYDKYFFGGWDKVESFPTPRVLYVLTSSEYDGLRHRDEFDIKKIIYYPNSTDAFFLVSVN